MSICRRCSASTWRCSALVAVLMGVVGCGGLQPASWMEEDEAFVLAVPDESRTQLDRPRFAGARSGEETALTLQALEPVVDALNAMTWELLGVLDTVASVPPTERTEDTRQWGPEHVSDLDITYQLDVRREDDLYLYEMRLDPGDTGTATLSVLDGSYLPTVSAHGAGAFELDGVVLGAMLPVSGVTGTLAVEHQRAESSLRVGMDLRGLQADGLDDLLVPDRYAYAEDLDGGRLCFLASVDWQGGDAAEQLQVYARWGEDGAGRADGTLTGGDLDEPIELAECWDDQGRPTYWWDSAGLFPETGDPASCPEDPADLPETCDDV